MVAGDPTIATITDIARLAQTSRTAVSCALNNRAGFVSEETRRRILQAAKELQYRPNRHARQLRRQQHMCLAVQLDGKAVYSNSHRQSASLGLMVYQGISEYAQSRGYHLQMILPREGRELLDLRRQIIEQDAVDGVILMGLPQQLDELVSDLDRAGIPAATIDYRLADRGTPLLSLDRSTAIEQAAQHIGQLGHRRAAFIGSRTVTVSEREPRYRTFQEALARSGVDLPDSRVLFMNEELQVFRDIPAVLTQPDPPSCLIFGGDHLAMAAIASLQAKGLSIPGDISIVSMNNAPYAQDCPVPLTTIDHLYFEQGQMLARLLIDRIEHPDEPVSAVSLLRAKYIHRQSLGSCSPTFTVALAEKLRQ